MITKPGNSQTLTPNSLDDFPAFIEAVSHRLEKSRNTYGDTSFHRPITELVEELQQECLDLAGWGFVLWSRLQRIKSATNKEDI